MVMVASAMESQMYATMLGNGLAGTSGPDFAGACADGCINGTIGAPFATTDTGTIPGTGAGTGVGVTGVVDAVLSAALTAGMLAKFGSIGTSTPIINDALAQAYVAQLAVATLTSTHAPVFVGSGIVNVGSIVVAAAVIESTILAAGISAGFLGTSWPDIASTVGTEIANALLLGTGSVTIAGAGTPPTSPGVGVGSGTLS